MIPTGGCADGMRVSHLIAQVSGAEHLAPCVDCNQGHGVSVAASLRSPSGWGILRAHTPVAHGPPGPACCTTERVILRIQSTCSLRV